MTTALRFLNPMLLVGAMFILFGFLRPGEDCGGHCRSCTGGSCGTKSPSHHV